ncbi:MAG: endonuclease V [Gammaproteobacteria bacterium]|nr:MAG: endonuclease V [Gammaproteobacteria bacterium]
MILATDVQYINGKGIAAGVLFENWTSSAPVGEYVSEIDIDEEYIPGQFYKRELPCILKLLHEYSLSPSIIVVDGYVFLDGVESPGLGKHLYDALAGKVVVVGVAKKAFTGIGTEHMILRGKSKNPVYITVVGDGLKSAKKKILSMDGKHRMPTLLKRADQLCRERANKIISPTQIIRG